jgi:hypothetical protein
MAKVGRTPLGPAQPEATINAAKQAADLVARLPGSGKMEAPTTRRGGSIARKFLVNHHG